MSLPALPVWVGAAATLIGFLSMILYVLHARRHPAPILNLTLFANRSFRASIVGGTLFRIAAGATPFLLPLMLQLGFGMTAFESGMTTFIAAIGAITTKFIARRAFAALGFRNVLIMAGFFGALTTAANALFTPATPILLIMAVLLLGGFCRSFFFTGVNTLGYAEIEDRAASQATSLTSVLQQVSLALGVAAAASILEASTRMSGGDLSLGDFQLAFAIVAGLSLFAVVPFFGLPRDVGSAVSGYRRTPEHESISVK